MKFLDADSPLMSALRRLWDYMGLNMCFILCCIPVVTVGSAHSAMYTAIRAIGRDEPWLKLYFSTFLHSFKKPTLVWLILLTLILVFGWNTVSLAAFNAEDSTPALVISCVCLGVAMCMSSAAFLLYSKFECTVFQLLRNSILTVIMYPIRCVIGTVLIWAPIIALCSGLFAWLFFETLLYQILFYYAFASFVFYWLMKKPLARMAGEEVPNKRKEKLDKKLMDLKTALENGQSNMEEDTQTEEDEEDTQET